MSVPRATELACIVAVPVTFPLPSNEAEVQTTSPVIPIVRPVANAVAVSALPVTSPDTSPVRSAVIVPAAKFPEPFRDTIVLFPALAVAFEVTVKVPPSLETDPESPVPEVAPAAT